MSLDAQYVIDRAAVEADVARTRALLEKGRGRYVVRQFLTTAITIYLITFIAKRDLLSRLGAMPLGTVLMLFLYPAIGALFIAFWSARETFKDENLDVDRRTQRISKDLRSLAGSGWIGRSLLLGIKLGVGIGLMVGVIMLLMLDVSRMGASSRPAFVASFVAITLLWTIPAAFLLRWLMLLALKKMVVKASPI